MQGDVRDMMQTGFATPVLVENTKPTIIDNTGLPPAVEPVVQPTTNATVTADGEVKPETPPPFVPTSQTTVAPLDTPAPTEPEAPKPTFFDQLQTKPVAPDKPAAPTIDPEIQAKLDRLAALEANPIVKLASGQYDLTKVDDLQSFLRQAAGEDYSQASNELLLRKSFEKEGLSGETLRQAVEETMLEKFAEDIPAWKQEIERKKLLTAVTKDQSPSQILQTLQEVKNAQAEALANQPDPAEEFERSISETASQFSDWAAQIEGQEYLGYVTTPEDAKAMAQEFVDRATTFDMKRVFMDIFKSRTYEKAVAAAEARGYEKAIRETSHPSRNQTSNVIMPKNETTDGLAKATTEDMFKQANTL